MTSRTNGFTDLRDRFRNKKKVKSFPNKQALDLLTEANAATQKSKSFKEKDSKGSRSRAYGRSSSTADVEIVMHNAVIREDSGTLGRVLNDENIQINRMSPAGYTALHQACILGNLPCAKLLVGAGADLFVKSKGDDTSLQLAVTNGHFEVAEFLISMGAKDTEIRDGVQPSRQYKGGSWHL